MTLKEKAKNFTFGFDIFENFQGMCFILSNQGLILDSNKSASDYLRKSKEELLDSNFFEIFESPLKEKLIGTFEKCLRNSETSNIPAQMTVGGIKLSLNLVFTPFADKGNPSIKYLFALARDISEQKKIEDDLLKFYTVAENTVNPLQITNLEGKMVYVNKAFVEASGYSKEDLLGKNPSVFGSKKHPPQFWKDMWETISTGKVWVGEVENTKKNGKPFYTQLLISPILDSKGKVVAYFGIHRDLSEKKMLEKQLIHTQKMESIGTLAAGVAHEVGNPLASISALVQVVLRSSEDEFVKEKLGLVKSQVTRISKIIRDLVDFSRPSNYELQLTDINQVILEAVEIVKVGKKAKTIEFETDLQEKIPNLPLVADQVQQVFVNILLNAVDAISEYDSVKERNKISAKSSKTENYVVINFSDNGPGISEENIAKVFEPFFTTKKEGKGTGLGLWVSYGIIKSFQGDIKIRSNQNEGTTFTITLPIKV
ncbi:MAG TPA: PAS domain S-box protein [Ignavibacteriaceae bacterium]|nr:PAS domain S-box protein [Ignavibacteriaceae bacterium]